MQQEKRFDKNQLIGFSLMAILFGVYFYINQPTQEQLEKQKLELVQKQEVEKKIEQNKEIITQTTTFDSIGESRDIDLENDKLKLTLSGKGGQISQLEIKNYLAYDSAVDSDSKPLYLINDGNSNFDLSFKNTKGEIIHTSDLSFVPTVIENNSSKTVTLNAQANGGRIQFIYSLGKDYGIDFEIRSQGLKQITTDDNVKLSWGLSSHSIEKGRQQEDYWAQTYYRIQNKKVDYDLFGTDEWDIKDEKLEWIAFKQQFFASFLSFKEGFEQTKGGSESLSKEGKGFSKKFFFESNLAVNNGEFNYKLNWDFLPLDYKFLKGYNDKDFQNVIPFGWGIFGWLNKYFFLNIFLTLAKLGMGYGWVILLMTIVVKLVLSPIMYKQFRQSAMMRILRPELNEINEKFKDSKDAMKKQKATMELYGKAGVNPLAGCLPALLQVPIFYALFRFFPNLITLRGESFLWAEDLTAYDSFIKLPDWVPFMDGHMSIFALCYIVAMLIYFKVSGSMDNFQIPQQEGMPNMQFMKYMMYVMPVFFFVFLNSYASGLSWYYLVSNVINIGIVLFIKKVMINDEKLHVIIQENKSKPKKKSGFGTRMQEMMVKAQEAQKEQEKNKKSKKK